MKRIPTTFVIAATLVATAHAQDKKDPAPPAIPAEIMELFTPGPEHKELAKQVGTWKTVQTLFMPGAPPMKTEGSSEIRLALDGRFLIADYEGVSPMGKYHGIGTTGYDKVNKRFFSTWIDSIGTGIMISYGKPKDDGSVEFISEPVTDPMRGGQKVVFRMVTRMKGADAMEFEMFNRNAEDAPDKEVKMMRIDYTRKK